MPVSPSRKRYYNSGEWDRLRNQCFARDGYRCRKCGALGRQAGGTAVLNAGHVVSRAKGGADVLSNLVTLCRSCHRKHDAAGHRADRPSRCPHGAVPSACRYCRAPAEPLTRCPHGAGPGGCWRCAKKGRRTA